ncbi:MAG TPA: LLM class flavin-dependent oxidoreductase [Kofleriaceae bacterium]|jgi:limonene 1,2-monooxygenase|nr:LLM class flavin-dependent oxidoreductase [Kofleriaceae bacterium]
MRFGIFMAPFHPAGVNPTLLIDGDLALIDHLDRLGFDEAWIGEHHSAGSEIIASPEIFIAAAAQRTRRIKLGTGVVSASYHNPLWVAERAVQLDHMTKGRFMLGLGPGALPSDAAMIGLDMPQTRELLEDAVDIITRLLRGDEPVSFENARWTLRDARLHLRPYSDPHPEIVIAAVASPSGPRLAGRYGHGLLSIGATTAAGFDVLGLHWGVMEERAAHYGATVDRNAWRLVGLVHLAETREQAYQDVEHGILDWFDYFQQTAAFPQMAVGNGTTARQCIDFVIESGFGAIGTPDDAIAQIRRLEQQSGGGFGAYLQLAHDWAAPAARFRSYELFARHVAPHFQGQHQPTADAKARARAVRPALAQNNLKAVEHSTAKYQAELAAKPKPKP